MYDNPNQDPTAQTPERGRRQVRLGFADRSLPEGAHIIYVYSDDDERKQSMARFLSAGLAAQEKLLYLVHDIPPEEMAVELGRLGVDPEASRSQLDITHNHPSHCPGECFSREFMLELVGKYYDDAIQDGFTGARGAGEMTWAAAKGAVDIDTLLAYESDLNAVLSQHPLTTICQYDARLFPGDVIMDLLSVHPLAIVRGQLVENPFFIPSADLQQSQPH